MSSMKILTVSLLPLLVAACTSPQKGGAVASAPQTTSTSAATRVPGDLIPAQLLSVTVPKPTELSLLQGSDALAPMKSFEVATAPQAVVARDVHKVMRGTDPSAFLLAVDAPVGARVIVHPLNPNANLTTVHLVDALTGARLDLARDESTMGINVQHGTAPTDAPNGLQDGRNAPVPQASGAIAREPGFEPLVLHTRVLSFDVPTKPGSVRVDVPKSVAADGIFVELQQPNSHITLSGIPDALEHGAGDTVTITGGVLSDTTGIDGAKLSGWAELPGNVHGADFTFESSGNGQYVAHLPVGTDSTTAGAWGIHLRATGTANGVAFERDVETSFGFYPSHAQMTSFGAPVVARGSDGLIDSVSVDVNVHTLMDDRFSVRGTLTYTDSTGAEHPLAAAQTGQVVRAGDGTITLRFDAAAMALANVSGPFNLRDVALVSQGNSLTQHRLGRGLEIATPAIAANEIRFPKTLSLQAQDLVRNGDLVLRQ